MTEVVDTNATYMVRQNSRKLLVWALFPAAFVVFALYVTWLQFRHGSFGDTGWSDAVMPFAALFFGVFLWVAVQRARDWDRVVLTLSPAGYHDAHSGRVTIPWHVVCGMKLLRRKGTHLRLFLTEAAAPLVERPGLLGQLQRLNTLSSQPTVTTNLNFLRIDPKRLFELVRAYAAAHGGSQNRI